MIVAIGFILLQQKKGIAPRTLLAGVTEDSATIPTNIVPDSAEKSNTFPGNSSENSENKRFSHKSDELDKSYLDAVEHNDTQTMQNMVEEAARRSGYPAFREI